MQRLGRSTHLSRELDEMQPDHVLVAAVLVRLRGAAKGQRPRARSSLRKSASIHECARDKMEKKWTNERGSEAWAEG
eukprot:6200641-Pleurochrysis_carterae.AAC.1